MIQFILLCALNLSTPPAPPGFPNQPLLSPKDLGQKTTLGPTMVELPVSPEHTPPVAVIRWQPAPMGCVETDKVLTNQVPVRIVQIVQLGLPTVGIQWASMVGKTYEIQVSVDSYAWLTYMRLTSDSTETKTGWCAISMKEGSRLFRVMTN